jgi:hypothetical protein
VRILREPEKTESRLGGGSSILRVKLRTKARAFKSAERWRSTSTTTVSKALWVAQRQTESMTVVGVVKAIKEGRGRI